MNQRVAPPDMRTNSYSRQRGVGMIEVLVSVLVLSVGLLGIALVQTRALANKTSSMGRSLATVATYSILEAIRADRANQIGRASCRERVCQSVSSPVVAGP